MTLPSIFLPLMNRHVKLGRIPPRVRPATLRFGNYLVHERMKGQLPTTLDWTPAAQASIAQVYLNDQLGDCVIASAYHRLGVWSANEEGKAIVVPDSEVDSMYRTICGPGDNGCVITDVLNYQQQTGFPSGKKIAGYVSVDNTKIDEVKAAIMLFGAVCLGVDLPGSWANNAAPGSIWDDTNDRSVGGHDVPCFGWNDKGFITSTWGMLVTITFAAMANTRIITECYASLSMDWVDPAKPSPNGVLLADLQKDLVIVGQGGLPPLPGPVPPPGPGPVPPPIPIPGTVVVSAPFSLPAGTYVQDATGGKYVLLVPIDVPMGTYSTPTLPAPPLPPPPPLPGAPVITQQDLLDLKALTDRILGEQPKGK